MKDYNKDMHFYFSVDLCAMIWTVFLLLLFIYLFQLMFIKFQVFIYLFIYYGFSFNQL